MLGTWRSQRGLRDMYMSLNWIALVAILLLRPGFALAQTTGNTQVFALVNKAAPGCLPSSELRVHPGDIVQVLGQNFYSPSSVVARVNQGFQGINPPAIQVNGGLMEFTATSSLISFFPPFPIEFGTVYDIAVVNQFSFSNARKLRVFDPSIPVSNCSLPVGSLTEGQVLACVGSNRTPGNSVEWKCRSNS